MKKTLYKSRTNKTIAAIVAVALSAVIAKKAGVDLSAYGLDVDTLTVLITAGLGALGVKFRLNARVSDEQEVVAPQPN
jgi:hypothetical protein